MLLAGQDLTRLDEDGRARLRAQRVGFVFQSFHLIPALTALENVMLPLELAGRGDARRIAAETLAGVGLGERTGHYPRQLSGGEQQRVALARAFVTRPAVLFADEPTGNLDTATGARVGELLFELNAHAHTTLVLVTHDRELAARCATRGPHGGGARPMKVVRLALRTLAREWRSGELGVLLLALTVAVAALTGVGFLVSRISAAVALQASEVLAADIRLGSPQPLAADYFSEAQRRGLQQRAQHRPAVGGVQRRGESADQRRGGHGRLSAARPPAARRRALRQGARRRRASRRRGRSGRTRSCWRRSAPGWGRRLAIGAASFRVGRVLISRPDQGGTFAELAPVLIMNAADLPAHAADPAGQPRELRRPVRRRARPASTPSRTGSRPTSAPASGCATSPTPVRRSRTPSIAPAASSAWRAW